MDFEYEHIVDVDKFLRNLRNYGETQLDDMGSLMNAVLEDTEYSEEDKERLTQAIGEKWDELQNMRNERVAREAEEARNFRREQRNRQRFEEGRERQRQNQEERRNRPVSEYTDEELTTQYNSLSNNLSRMENVVNNNTRTSDEYMDNMERLSNQRDAIRSEMEQRGINPDVQREENTNNSQRRKSDSIDKDIKARKESTYFNNHIKNTTREEAFSEQRRLQYDIDYINEQLSHPEKLNPDMEHRYREELKVYENYKHRLDNYIRNRENGREKWPENPETRNIDNNNQQDIQQEADEQQTDQQEVNQQQSEQSLSDMLDFSRMSINLTQDPNEVSIKYYEGDVQKYETTENIRIPGSVEDYMTAYKEFLENKGIDSSSNELINYFNNIKQNNSEKLKDISIYNICGLAYYSAVVKGHDDETSEKIITKYIDAIVKGDLSKIPFTTEINEHQMENQEQDKDIPERPDDQNNEEDIYSATTEKLDEPNTVEGINTDTRERLDEMENQEQDKDIPERPDDQNNEEEIYSAPTEKLDEPVQNTEEEINSDTRERLDETGENNMNEFNIDIPIIDNNLNDNNSPYIQDDRMRIVFEDGTYKWRGSMPGIRTCDLEYAIEGNGLEKRDLAAQVRLRKMRYPKEIKNVDGRIVEILAKEKGNDIALQYIDAMINKDKDKMPCVLSYDTRNMKGRPFREKIRMLKLAREYKNVMEPTKNKGLGKKIAALGLAALAGLSAIGFASSHKKDDKLALKEGNNRIVDDYQNTNNASKIEQDVEKQINEYTNKQQNRNNRGRYSDRNDVDTEQQYKNNNKKSWELNDNIMKDIEARTKKIVEDREIEQNEKQDLQLGSVLKLPEGMTYMEGVSGGRTGKIGTEYSPKDGMYVIDHVAEVSENGVSNRAGLEGNLNKLDPNAKQYVHIAFVPGAKNLKEAQKLLEQQKSGKNKTTQARGWVSLEDLEKAMNEQQKTNER